MIEHNIILTEVLFHCYHFHIYVYCYDYHIYQQIENET